MADNPYERDTPDEPAEPTSREPDEGGATRADARTAPTPDTAVEPADGAAPSASGTWRHDGDRPAESAGTDPDGTVTSTFDVREAGTDRPSGGHETERRVPRAGLAEHRSASYLTGDQSPDRDTEPTGRDDPSTTRTDETAPWLAGGTAAAAAGHSDDDTRDARPERDVVLDGTTADARPPSRTRAHVLAILLSLLLTPVAWYLLADAGARLTLPQGNPWDTANLNVAALLELAGGLLVLAAVLLGARWSSVGVIVTGVLVLLVGIPFVAVPAWTQDVLDPIVSWFARLGEFGDNVTHHLVASGSTGRLVIGGVALVLVGVVSHGARRQGRREVRPVVEA